MAIISKITLKGQSTAITGGSGNQQIDVHVSSTTGRGTEEQSKTITASKDPKPSKTFKVIRTGRPVFLDGGTDHAFSGTVANTGGTVKVTGTSNSGNIKLASSSTVISGVKAAIKINGTTDSAWNGTTNISLSGTAGQSAQYNWEITFTIPANESEGQRRHILDITDGVAAGTDTENHQVAVTITQAAGVKYYTEPVLTLEYNKTKFGAAADTATIKTAKWVQYWKWNSSSVSASSNNGSITGGATDGTWVLEKYVDTDNKNSTATVSTSGVVSVTSLGTHETSAVDPYLKVTWIVTFDRGASGVKQSSISVDFSREANSKSFNGATITGITSTLPGSPKIERSGTDYIITLNPGVATTVDKTNFSFTVQNSYSYSSGEIETQPAISSADYTIGSPSGVNSSVTTTSKGLTATTSDTTAGIFYLLPTIIKDGSATVSYPGTTSQFTVKQAKNELTYDAVTWSVTTPVSLNAAGQTYTFTKNASQKYTSTANTYNNVAKASVAASSFIYSYVAANTQTGFTLDASAGKVTADNNKSTAVRPANSVYYTVNATATGLGGKSKTNTVNFNQNAGAKVYSDLVLKSFSYPEIPAVKDTTTILPTIHVTQDWTWNGVSGSGGTLTWNTANGTTLGGNGLSSYGITFSNSKLSGLGTASESAPFAITVNPAGTTYRAANSNVATASLNFSANGHVFSPAKTCTITSQANIVKTYGTPVIEGSVKDIPASGGSVASFASSSDGVVNYTAFKVTQVQTYTSTASTTVTLSTSPTAVTGTLSYSTSVSASNRSTTVGARTKVGTLTCTYTSHGTGTLELDVYQQANLVYYKPIEYTINPSTTIHFSGSADSYEISTSTQGASAEKVYTSGSTSNVSVNLSVPSKTGVLTTGSVSGNKCAVSVTANPTVSTRTAGTVTVKWTDDAVPSAEQSYLASNEAGTIAVAYKNFTLPTAQYTLSFDQYSGDSTLTVTPDVQTVDYNGGKVTFTVTSNDTWTIS